MSAAVLLATIAGVLAAAAIVEGWTWGAARRAGRRGGAAGWSRRVGGARAAAALAQLGRRAGLPLPASADLAARLAAAGVPERIRPADAMAVKAGAALSGALLSLPLALAAPGRLGLALLLAGPTAGFLAPDVVLGRRARRRRGQIALEVADVLDLLRVAVAAGLPPGRALAEVGRRRGGVLGAELRTASAKVELGVGRREAYAQLGARCPLPEVSALVVALERAEHHGTPLAPALASLAVEARATRARALQDRAAKAAPKIQLVIALLLVPAVMLLLAAALLRTVG